MNLTPQEWYAVILSLQVGFWAALIGLPLAIALAWVLARTTFRGKIILDTLIHLPLVVPPVVTGYLLIQFMGRRSLFGGWFESLGFELSFNWKGAVLAAMVMSLPLMVRAIRLSFEAVDSRLEDAARTLGAGGLRVFLTITLPLAWPGVLSGVILGFARSLGEFGATITFVSNIPGETQTLPLALYSATQIPGGEPIALRLCVISILIAFVALVGAEVLARRGSYDVGSGRAGHACGRSRAS